MLEVLLFLACLRLPVEANICVRVELHSLPQSLALHSMKSFVWMDKFLDQSQLCDENFHAEGTKISLVCCAVPCHWSIGDRQQSPSGHCFDKFCTFGGKLKCRGRKSVVTCILEASFAARGGLLYPARGALNHILRDICSKIRVTTPNFRLTGWRKVLCRNRTSASGPLCSLMPPFLDIVGWTMARHTGPDSEVQACWKPRCWVRTL